MLPKLPRWKINALEVVAYPFPHPTSRNDFTTAAIIRWARSSCGGPSVWLMVFTGVPSISTVYRIVIAPVVLFDLHLMTCRFQDDALGVAVLMVRW